MEWKLLTHSVSKRYQTHGSQFSFLFPEWRFHIKSVIRHSFMALSSQLIIQTLFIIAKHLKRTHPVLTHLKRQNSKVMSGQSCAVIVAAVLVTATTWVESSWSGDFKELFILLFSTLELWWTIYPLHNCRSLCKYVGNLVKFQGDNYGEKLFWANKPVYLATILMTLI